MPDAFAHINIIILGGDRRELELYRCWKKESHCVKLAGFELGPVGPADLAGPAERRAAAVIITPLSGIKAGGIVSALFAAEPPAVQPYIEEAGRKVLLLAGSLAPGACAWPQDKVDLVLTASDQELALLNAVPTAEGAVQKAMELSEITLHGSRVLVLGLGRCGTALARLLQGLGAAVRAVVRRRESAAFAQTIGVPAIFFTALPEVAGEADFIFNTVPAPVLDSRLLEQVNRACLILDLAAAPGGTDFKAAAALGLRAELLPGLPGLTAPRTAGRILARVYRRIILENLVRRGGDNCWTWLQKE